MTQTTASPTISPAETALFSDRALFTATGLKQAILISRDGTVSEVTLSGEFSSCGGGCYMRHGYTRGTTLVMLRKEANNKLKQWTAAKR